MWPGTAPTLPVGRHPLAGGQVGLSAHPLPRPHPHPALLLLEAVEQAGSGSGLTCPSEMAGRTSLVRRGRRRPGVGLVPASSVGRWGTLPRTAPTRLLMRDQSRRSAIAVGRCGVGGYCLNKMQNCVAASSSMARQHPPSCLLHHTMMPRNVLGGLLVVATVRAVAVQPQGKHCPQAGAATLSPS